MSDQPSDPAQAAVTASGGTETTPDLWHVRNPDHGLGGPRYASLLEAFRLLQNQFAGANLLPNPTTGDDPTAELVVRIQSIADALSQFQVDENSGPVGSRDELPGRGNPMFPPFVVERETADSVSGTVTFARFHLGGNNAAHGGALAVLFDELMGRLISRGPGSVSRTAYLHVNYRRIAPIGRDLHFAVTIDRTEGRKTWTTGRVHDGPDLVADADALFVRLLPGQQ